ncbi:hypothetical protein ACFCV3_41705 [Kribbella sp. NPDC056345]|uniref:hypothetical protein n=1 Tax=Kribbella sp. NPDC056345 TaxID=3345789 RepID=UPI0035D998FE
MITETAGRCWILERDGDQWHFPTRKAATKWAGKNYTGKPARRSTVPCWIATCSTPGCDGFEGTEDGDHAHIAALNAKHALTELGELRLDHGELLCTDCVEKAKPPAPAPGTRPTTLTYDDIAHALILLVQLRKQLPGYLPHGSTDYDTLATVEALVGHHPVGADKERLYVHPFAVQPPLPDMPPVSIATAGSLR